MDVGRTLWSMQPSRHARHKLMRRKIHSVDGLFAAVAAARYFLFRGKISAAAVKSIPRGAISYLGTHAASDGDSIRRSDTRTFRTCPTSGGAFPARTGIRTANKGLRTVRAYLLAMTDALATRRPSCCSSSRVNLCNNCWRSLSRMTYCSWFKKKKEKQNGEHALPRKVCTDMDFAFNQNYAGAKLRLRLMMQGSGKFSLICWYLEKFIFRNEEFFFTRYKCDNANLSAI